MTTDVYAQPGGEKYVKFAKTKLSALTQVREGIGLPVLRKHFVPEDGVRIDIMSSEYGDRIRIFAGNLFLVQVGSYAGGAHYRTFSRQLKQLNTSTNAFPTGLVQVRLAATSGMGLAQNGTSFTFQPLDKKGMPGTPTSVTVGTGDGAVLSRDVQHAWTLAVPPAFNKARITEANADGTGSQIDAATPWATFDATASLEVPGNKLTLPVTGSVEAVTIISHDWAILNHVFGGPLELGIFRSAPVVDVPGQGSWATLYSRIGRVASPDDSTVYAWGAERSGMVIVSPGVLGYTITAMLFKNGSVVDSWPLGPTSSPNELGVAQPLPFDMVAATNETGSAVVYATNGFWRIYSNAGIYNLRVGPGLSAARAWITDDATRVVIHDGAFLWFYENGALLGTVSPDAGTLWANPATGRILCLPHGAPSKEYFFGDGVVGTKTGPTLVSGVAIEDLFTNKI